MAEEQTESQDGGGVAAAEREDTLTVTDNRTGETYEVPVTDGTVKAMDFRQMKVAEDDFGLMTYDPAYTNTASCRSDITFIDGEAGILQHRGIPIEHVAWFYRYARRLSAASLRQGLIASGATSEEADIFARAIVEHLGDRECRAAQADDEVDVVAGESLQVAVPAAPAKPRIIHHVKMDLGGWRMQVRLGFLEERASAMEGTMQRAATIPADLEEAGRNRLLPAVHVHVPTDLALAETALGGEG